jgi:Amt family ammonium transporter
MMKVKVKKVSLVFLLVLLFTVACSIYVFAEGPSVAASDPAGTAIGSSLDIPAVTSGAPTLDEIAAQVGKNKIGINYVWVILTGCLIFFFQAGFAMVETGFTSAKNAMHTMAMNLMVFLVGTLGFYFIGFALMFGGVGGWSSLGISSSLLNHEVAIGSFGLFGTKGFMLTSGGSYDAGVFALFFFQMVFMDTTCTIPTGSMAERVKFSAVVISSFFISTVYYPLFGNWVWGAGWLSQLGKNFGIGHGVVDFAGSAVVHAMGGMIALSGAIVIGPRIGKFRKDGTPVAIPGHDLPMAMIGTIILFFGWFAFNAGSTTNGTDFRIAVVATNTMLAGAAGGFVAMMYMWKKYGKPDPSMTCNGALAGLVAITAPCAFVNSMAALLIGIIAGAIVCIAVSVVENKFKIDDPVGAIAVHAVNGIWGVLALGIFADGTYGEGLNGVAGGVTGLLYGDPSQFLAQFICVVTIIVWGFGSSYAFWRILDKIIGIRVNADDEVNGLDIPEMGVLAYPNFKIGDTTSIELASSVESPKGATLSK